MPFGLTQSITDSIYVAEQNFVLVEAETLPHSANWVFQNERKNYWGDGYLRWVGGVQGSGHEQETDRDGSLQGDPKDWLRIPVKILEAGTYRMNLRNTHEHKDGDNDVWIHIEGFPPPIQRVGDHSVKTFQWLTWGLDWVKWELKPGIYTFYIAGRSDNFAIDRILIFHENAPAKIYYRDNKPTKKSALQE